MWHSDGHICRDITKYGKCERTHNDAPDINTLGGLRAQEVTRNRVRLPSVISGSSVSREKEKKRKKEKTRAV